MNDELGGYADPDGQLTVASGKWAASPQLCQCDCCVDFPQAPQILQRCSSRTPWHFVPRDDTFALTVPEDRGAEKSRTTRTSTTSRTCPETNDELYGYSTSEDQQLATNQYAPEPVRCGKLGTSNWELATGNWELGTLNPELATGNWPLATGHWQPKGSAATELATASPVRA